MPEIFLIFYLLVWGVFSPCTFNFGSDYKTFSSLDDVAIFKYQHQKDNETYEYKLYKITLSAQDIWDYSGIGYLVRTEHYNEIQEIEIPKVEIKEK